MSSACAFANASSDWPEWNDFVGRFVQADGRVIDLTFERKSTSEGQSYALFFALVANQRAQFDTLLKWTSDNLAAGQLGDKLPAWLWGLRDDGSWGVKDRERGLRCRSMDRLHLARGRAFVERAALRRHRPQAACTDPPP